MDLDTIAGKIDDHHAKTKAWHESMEQTLKQQPKGDKMGMDNLSDRVNINMPGSDGGGGGAGLAAVIAALGNRNQGDNSAALIAALGNRNDDSSNLLGPMMAMMAGRRNDGDGMGMNAMLPLLLLALLGRGRGGLLGGGDDCGPTAGGITPGHAALLQTLLEGQNQLTAAVPTTALQTQIAVNGAIGQLALGTQQGFSNVKDSVQNTSAVTLAALSGVKDSVQNTGAALALAISNANQQALEQGCQTRAAIAASETAILSKIDQNTIDDLRQRAERAERSVEVNALRSTVEINNSATASSNQAQGQFQVQAQFQDIGNQLRRCFERLDVVHQEQRSTNANIIAGNLGAVTTGPQTSTPTNVNAR